MGSLQSRKSNGKTYYQKQVYLGRGKRTTIRLGALSQKAAVEISRHVDHLIAAKRHGTRVDETTEAWLRTADGQLVSKLSHYGLCAKFSDPTVVGFVAQFMASKKAKSSPATVTCYAKAERHLTDYFGNTKRVAEVTREDAKAFQKYLEELGTINQNTINRRCGYVVTIFNEALETDIIRFNPFKLSTISTSVGVGKKDYIEPSVIHDVIRHCPSNEWKLLFAFARFIGNRMPSEINGLTWAHVLRDKNAILLKSPKTARKGKPDRLVPIFPEVRELLQRQYDEAEPGTVYVFHELRRRANLGVPAGRIVELAGHVVWPNFFNSLRASRETDLMDQYGLRRACAWIGNSPQIAMRNYALLRKQDYLDVADAPAVFMGEKSDAKSDAAPASLAETGSAAFSEFPTILGDAQTAVDGT